MAIELEDLFSSNEARLAQAQVLTRTQLDLAKDLIATQFNGEPGAQTAANAIALAQVLATNLLAEHTRTQR